LFYLKAALITLIGWLTVALLIAFATINGWWYTPMVADADAKAFMQAASKVIESENVGNVALVLIEDGEVYGQHFAAVSQELDKHTLFAAASMSKWVTALGVMKLVQQGKIDLDVPITGYLSRWQLPDSDFHNEKVTVRQLLSHTSGLADGLGFGDYRADETLPSLEASLSHPRASSGREVSLALAREPGTEWDYSGGGYLILQLIIEEVSGQRFATFMQETIFNPLAMTRSTYNYIGTLENRADSYDRQGQQAPLYQYACSAATGLSSSVSDMTKLVRSLLAGSHSPAFLRQDTISAMRKPNASLMGFDIWGLGTILYASTASGDVIYGHDGQNDPAINSAVRINPDTGDAIIAFSSGNPSLATKLGFEWVFSQTGKPDFLGLGYVIPGGLRVLSLASMLTLLIAGVLTWRRRPNAR